jgi:lactococcin 972 family bacteriocin
MKTKSLVLALSAVTLFSAGGIVAQAEGTWQHGYGVSSAYSNYHHGSKTHSATVVNNNTGRQGKDTQRAGVWAKATVGRNLTEKASFYYNFR